MNKAFFLDRDGTLNEDYNNVHSPEKWTWCEGALDAIRWINEHHFKAIVVTNQSGISKGKFTFQQVQELHRWVDDQLEKQGLWIDDWFIAPWHPDFEHPGNYDPNDRKPGTGMFLKAGKKYNIDFSKSYMAGDKITDLKPAVKLGITPFFIRSRFEPSQDSKWLDKHKLKTWENIGQIISHLS